MSAIPLIIAIIHSVSASEPLIIHVSAKRWLLFVCYGNPSSMAVRVAQVLIRSYTPRSRGVYITVAIEHNTVTLWYCDIAILRYDSITVSRTCIIVVASGGSPVDTRA